jgi:protein-tyrosine phosphatase
MSEFATKPEAAGARVRVLFVCMGNICRSPTAEAVFKHLVEQAGEGARVLSDSAGTHDYHVGAPPDERAQAAARQRGYDLSALRARQIQRRDFAAFDYVLAMDGHNLEQLARNCPQEHRQKLRLFTSFADGARRDVPDPYYGGAQGFEQVLDMVEDAAQALLRHIRNTLD